MIKTKLNNELFDKIKENSRIVIFGAGEVGKKIFNDIRREKPNAQILGFIDNFQKGLCLGLPIWSIKQFIDSKANIDLVVMSTRTNENIVNNIISLYDYNIVCHSDFLHHYYRNTSNILSEKNYIKVKNIFSRQEDKDLFDLLFKVRRHVLDKNDLKDYYNNTYLHISQAQTVIKEQYLEKINKENIKIIYDLGMNSGLNIIAFNKLLNNLEKIYGFEAIYEEAKVEYIEEFIKSQKLEIIEAAVGEKEGAVDFYINKNSSYSSFCNDISTKNLSFNTDSWEKRSVNLISIDNFSQNKDIRPSFIKMDIEGAEMSALKGGLKTIQKYRPQLAISIYHSDEDFINIPLYLSNELDNYHFSLGHYHPTLCETILYAIPDELV